MLGIDKSTSSVISGKYAEELRAAIRRKYTNQPNDSDIKAVTRSKQIKSEFTVVSE